MKNIAKVLVLCSSLCLLAGCGEVPDEDPNTGEVDQNTNLKTFDKVIFEDKSVEYDGNFHTISPVGMPSNTTVFYIGNNSFKEIGDYDIKIKLSKEGYKDKQLVAKLHITLPAIKNATITPDTTILYDGSDHRGDIKVTIKDDSLTEEEIKDVYNVSGPYIKKDGKDTKEVINTGVYTFHYKVDREGYKQLHLYSELTIDGKDFTLVSLSAEKKEIPFDGKDHANDITVNKLLNPDATVTKLILKEDGTETDTIIDVGTYTVTFLVQEPNYKDKTLIATVIIYDGKTIKNEVNKIQTYTLKDDKTNNYKIMFKDLHNEGKLTSLEDKDAVPTIISKEEIVDYTISNGILFYKTSDNKIKFAELGTSIISPKLLEDQTANLDLTYVQNKDLIYTRHNETTGKDEICRLENDLSITTLYEGSGISHLTVNQNKVYFLEKSGLFNKTIKTFSLVLGSPTVEVTLLSTDISNVVDFKISDKYIYFLSSYLLTKSINSYNLYGTKKEVKKIVDVTGENIEFLVNGNELIYKNKILVGEGQEGIFKHFIDNKAEDIMLFDTKTTGMVINSLTLFEEQLYFSNKSDLNCHLYRIPSFGVSKEAILVK